MSNRFAKGLGGIKEAAGRAPSPAPADLSPTMSEDQARAASSALAPSRKGKVVISAYFDPAVRQQLAIMAIKQNKSQAALLAEAMNLLFERDGEPPIAKA